MDDLAGLTPGIEAPAEAVAPPVAPAVPDIESRFQQLEASFKAEMDTRVKGFQKALSQKDKDIKALRESQMSEAEVAEYRRQEEGTEVERLQAENALLKLAASYPDEVPLFQQILEAPGPEEQLKLIREFRKGQAAAASSTQQPATEPEVETPPVDFNNPLAPYMPNGANVTYQGQQVTEAWADRLLDGASSMASRR